MAREIEALVTSATSPCFTKPMMPCAWQLANRNLEFKSIYISYSTYV